MQMPVETKERKIPLRNPSFREQVFGHASGLMCINIWSFLEFKDWVNLQASWKNMQRCFVQNLPPNLWQREFNSLGNALFRKMVRRRNADAKAAGQILNIHRARWCYLVCKKCNHKTGILQLHTGPRRQQPPIRIKRCELCKARAESKQKSQKMEHADLQRETRLLCMSLIKLVK